MPRFFYVFACIFLFSSSLWAQDFYEEFTEKPMPKIEEIAEEAFWEISSFHDEAPYGDEVLSYQVRLPSTWMKAQEQEIDGSVVVRNILREIARFDGPIKKNLRAKFVIKAEELAYQSTALQWFMQYSRLNALTIQGLEVIDDSSLDALYVQIEDGISYIVRSRIKINAKTLLLAQYSIPAQHWSEDKAIQLASMKSFVLKEEKQESVELFKYYHFSDIAEFKYPISWVLQDYPSRSAQRFRASIHKIGEHDVLKAKIDIHLIARSDSESLADEIGILNKTLNKEGLYLKDVIEVLEGVKIDESLQRAGSEIYQIQTLEKDKINYEMALSILGNKDYYIFVSILSPSRQEDFFLWSQNIEIYKLILQAVKLI